MWFLIEKLQSHAVKMFFLQLSQVAINLSISWQWPFFIVMDLQTCRFCDKIGLKLMPTLTFNQ